MIHQLLTSALRKALQLKLNGETKYILFSDIHKGDNSYADDFKHNIKIYKEALHHYYINDYTYIELGDGLELWENRKIKPIIKAHQVIFDLLKEFHHKNRLYLIYGNHDMTMMYQFRVRKLLGSIFTNLKYHESILLDTGKPKHNLLLLHGHQADYMNYLFWWFHRFLVRYVWKPLQLLGINDPTSPAKNYKSLIKVERRMKDWILKNNNQPVIFGHTHRPRFPKPQDIPMFNTGSCVHPESIIGIEIENMQISMVQWLDNEDSQKTVKVILEGPIDLNLFWK
jgi:UDP-2,3-diacylglucosamine pyrophosphatase LpxH